MSIELAEVQRRLRYFADHEGSTSPLYAHLAGEAAHDDAVAGLLTAARDQQAWPTLLLAAAHRLLQADPINPLSRYYPSLGGAHGVDDQTWPLFRDFILSRAEQAQDIIASRYTQTNEVRRAAVLYPAISLAARGIRGKGWREIGLLEVGCSAGLLLGLDTFSYRYQRPGGEQLVSGPTKAAVGLHCAWQVADGAQPIELPRRLSISAKFGLDQAPVDASDEDELAWLEACIWADQPDRIRLLHAAVAAQRKDPPTLIAGDAIADVAVVAERVPSHLPLVVMTSCLLGYLGDDERQAAFIGELARLAENRELWWISNEPYMDALRHLLPVDDWRASVAQGPDRLVGVVHWEEHRPRAKAQVTVLGTAAPHGQRMTWLPPA